MRAILPRPAPAPPRENGATAHIAGPRSGCPSLRAPRPAGRAQDDRSVSGRPATWNGRGPGRVRWPATASAPHPTRRDLLWHNRIR
ncbi:hypothetical protein GCM10022220_37250 [Actinocatenispora rupis]|uniref:Uncharacterized protein n=1 Tax=Actinocatenispora rupis TaxID=519421 RepID=A0A8J3J571_9ACTN|nr:hypothetical protein Aru02nite_30710 [Actinocatenispora rupis]